jgi:hypothetical protein
MTVVELVSETSVDLNHLPELSARENVSEFCCYETFNTQCQLVKILQSGTAQQSA